MALGALVAGFAVGDLLLGPMIAEKEASEEAAALRAARFARRSIDPARTYPDPPPYRTAMPSFPAGHVPDYAASAREKAQRAYASGRRGAHDRQDDGFGLSPWREPWSAGEDGGGSRQSLPFGRPGAPATDRHRLQ